MSRVLRARQTGGCPADLPSGSPPAGHAGKPGFWFHPTNCLPPDVSTLPLPVSADPSSPHRPRRTRPFQPRTLNREPTNSMPHTLPPLPYDKAALEPHIDATTMEIHHDKHHNAYVTNLNNAIAGKADLEAMSIDDLCKNISKVPSDIQTAVRNNGGGHWNHTFFWNIMGPNAGG